MLKEDDPASEAVSEQRHTAIAASAEQGGSARASETTITKNEPVSDDAVQQPELTEQPHLTAAPPKSKRGRPRKRSKADDEHADDDITLDPRLRDVLAADGVTPFAGPVVPNGPASDSGPSQEASASTSDAANPLAPVAGPAEANASSPASSGPHDMGPPKKKRKAPRKLQQENRNDTSAALTPDNPDAEPVPSAKEVAKSLFNGSLANPFPCPHDGCSKRFGRKSDFVRHYRTHTQERPFRCAHAGCNKTFIQAAALTVHERTHTGEKPAVCDEPGCGVAFADTSSLARHKTAIHSNARPFHCQFCSNASFGRQSSLNRHLKTCRSRRALERSLAAADPGPSAQAAPASEIGVPLDPSPAADGLAIDPQLANELGSIGLLPSLPAAQVSNEGGDPGQDAREKEAVSALVSAFRGRAGEGGDQTDGIPV